MASLEEALQAADSPLDRFRSIETKSDNMTFSDLPYSFPDERTNWIEEQRAWRETCILADQSYHMVDLYVEGPDALELFTDIGVNSFSSFESGDAPQAKQLVTCNHDGYVIGDLILFYLDTNRFLTVGMQTIQNWIEFNAEIGEYDLTTDRVFTPGDNALPDDFRFEVQGPNAIDVMEAVTDEPLPPISFFEMDTIEIAGTEVYVLGHAMAGEKGLEIFGPYEHGEEIKQRILKAGEEHDIRELGSKSYRSTVIESGWISRPVPAIYDSEQMRPYREWLDAEGFEGTIGISGSYVGDDITEYYLSPIALGYEHIISFDHDFIGRSALEDKVENPEHQKVTLVWNDKDVIEVFASLFRDGETYRFMNLPDPRNLTAKYQYDAVSKDGEPVGVSISPKYLYNEREMLSLCCIDPDYSFPGTEVTLTWGEPDMARSTIERHTKQEIRATVAPAPYVTRKREM